MGEIKSTLDLVMERTKNLSLTEDEKQHQEIENVKKNFNGMVQKYLDQLLNIEEVQKEFTDLRQKHPAVDGSELVRVILDKIDLDTLDGPLPDLLQALFGCRVEELKQIGRAYLDQLQSKAETHGEQFRQALKSQFRISGSAVLPNVDADPQWRSQVQVMRKTYTEQLTKEKEDVRVALP